MEFLQLNLDAYRIVAEILNELRAALREDLESQFGKQWFRTGLSEDVFKRLVGRKERETAIDWHDREYQELLDFMGFGDLVDILDNNPDCLKFLSSLAPSKALLHARFLELEVIRRRLGMTRPISESELSFLGNFHLRLHRAMNQPAEATKEAKPADAEHITDASEALRADESDEHAEKPRTKDRSKEPREPSNVTPIRPPAPATTDTVGAGQAAALAPKAEPAAEVERVPMSRHERVKKGLARGDRQTVLSELYTEVTELAEGLWSSSGGGDTPVWDVVRESDWYEDSFSNLGLKPLSDFYEILVSLQNQREDGMSNDELQGFLKERNFAQVLLALRDMFQRNRI
jgi:hypothetical protein